MEIGRLGLQGCARACDFANSQKTAEENAWPNRSGSMFTFRRGRLSVDSGGDLA